MDVVVSKHGYVFELSTLSSLDPFFYNFKPTPKTNVELFLTTIMYHRLQLSLGFIIRFKALDEIKVHHLVLSIFIN